MITQYSYGLNTQASQNNNVVDIYKRWTAEEVRADLQEDRGGLVNVCLNLTHDFNKSSIIRAANCFLADSTYVVGRKRFDTRGAVGATHYEHVYHADTLGEVIDKLHEDGYHVFAVDNVMEYSPTSLWEADIPYKSAFVYGEESLGLSREAIEMCDSMVYVRQRGAIRSLNVAQAAACVMAEYTRRYFRE